LLYLRRIIYTVTSISIALMRKNDFYKRLLFREFYYSPHLSSTDLSELTGKSLPLIIKILNELVSEGSVIESGYAPSSGGRRPQMYTVKPDTLYILAVSMDQLVTRLSLMDLQHNHVVGIEKIELPLKNNPAVCDELVKQMENLIRKSGIQKRKIAGIGIGMPGFIDVEKGINYSFPFSADKETTAVEYIAGKMGMPVYIDNDSSLIGLAESRFGVARGRKNAMVINIGWGIGLGMILDGKMFRGNNGFAGEFSHIPLFNNNKLCSCGKSGCLETEASLLVLVEKAKQGLKAGRISSLADHFPCGDAERDCEAIIAAAFKGDQFAVELLTSIGYNIGRGIAILIHITNPESVILSGRGSLGGKLWQAPVQQALNEHCIPRLADHTVVEMSKLGYQAELIGSAALVMENYVQQLAVKSNIMKASN
jgi:predicted NBD/HSP70 family sugar kinase